MNEAKLIIEDFKEKGSGLKYQNIPNNVNRLIIFSEYCEGELKIIAKAYSMNDGSLGISETGLKESKFKLSILRYLKKVLSGTKEKFISICVADEKMANKLSKFLGGQKVGVRIRQILKINPLYNVYRW